MRPRCEMYAYLVTSRSWKMRFVNNFSDVGFLLGLNFDARGFEMFDVKVGRDISVGVKIFLNATREM